jgi:23S rRNA pseudouridine1911/1915/1917 synthase
MPARILEITTQASQAGERVDKAMAEEIEGLSRSAAQRLIKKEQVTVNAAPVKASYRLAMGDVIVVRLPASKPKIVRPEPIPLDVLHQDDSLIVVNKPAGMVAHPAPGHPSGTLVNALLAHEPSLAQMTPPERAGLVHRLDKDTSGVIVAAKTEAARRALQAQFKARKVQKSYLALVEGHPVPPRGRIEAAIGRDPKNRKRMAAIHGGRRAVTTYRVRERFADHTLMEVRPKTGRTHQIRVHMAFIGHPIVGDLTYGYRKQRLTLERQFLHAWRIQFLHPKTGQSIAFEAPFPPDLEAILTHLRGQSPQA